MLQYYFKVPGAQRDPATEHTAIFLTDNYVFINHNLVYIYIYIYIMSMMIKMVERLPEFKLVELRPAMRYVAGSISAEGAFEARGVAVVFYPKQSGG